jgi:hypothetical protein
MARVTKRSAEGPINLRNLMVFGPISLSGVGLEMPWPQVGDALIRKTVGDEHFIYPVEKAWYGNELTHLTFFAMQYRESARKLVRDWLEHKDHPENVAYAIAYLYRHAIELEMKWIIVRRQSFQVLPPAEQRELLRTHSLHALWNKVKTVIDKFTDAGEIAKVEPLILQLHQLDQRSDGFRYPFKFGPGDAREPALGGDIGYASFENLVHKLEAISNWLDTTDDVENEYQQNEAWMRDHV